jgi:DNA ligase-1
MQLEQLAAASQRTAQTARRSEKIGALADCLRRLSAAEIELGVAFLSGEIRQSKLGVGPAAILAARPGGAAATSTLTLTEVDAALEHIAGLSGPGSTAERKQKLSQLLARATAEEQGFLVRLLFGELRQGALAGLMQEAIAAASGVDLARVRRAAMVAGGLAPVARAALMEGAPGLSRFALQLFQPIQPMLAQPAEDVEDALSQLGQAALEWKLDGVRVQAHKSGDQVRIFTRGLNEITPAVPEIVEAVRAVPARELILDGEGIALRGDGRPQPFQLTMRRFGRKLDIDAARGQLPLSVFFFDCLRRDGQDLLDLPAVQRFVALAEAVPAALLVPRLVTAEAQAAQGFLDHAIAQGHEGIMAKSLASAYEAGSRGSGWLKIKRAHTLDLVVLAAEWGSGRRHGWLSNLHLGARDPGTGQFVMLGKTFKGMTDQMLEWQTTRLQQLELGRDRYTVYVRPELVVEIAVNEIQASAQYPGGMALRFARVKRYRLDKRAEEADTIDTIRALFQQQVGRQTGSRST